MITVPLLLPKENEGYEWKQEESISDSKTCTLKFRQFKKIKPKRVELPTDSEISIELDYKNI